MTAIRRHRRPDILDEIPLDRDTVIEASAGTGKTFTIEHLVIELLLRTDVRIEEILVVTFTEKATGELRMRVRQKIEALVNSEEGDAEEGEPAWEIGEAERERLDAALSAFDSAPISTIHAFCQRVLTENAFEGSRLFEQTQVDGDEAFSAAFREALRLDIASDTEQAQWLAGWLEQFSVGRLEELLRHCHRARGELRPSFDEDSLSDTAEFDSTEMDPQRLEVELREAGLKGPSLNAVLKEFKSLIEALELTRSGPAPSRLRALSGWNDSRRGGTKRWVEERLPGPGADGPITQRFRALLEAVDTVIPFEAAIVHRFLPLVRHRLETRKREFGLFDFDDMLQLVHRGLGNDRLVRALRERYRFALIDEFQDTDEIQWDIFQKVFFESDQHRLFIIGDPKQAIYRFRGADIHTYFRAKEAIVSSGGALVSLAMNYRSTPGVIAAYNRIFDQKAVPPFFSRPGTYDDPVGCGNPSLQVVDAEGNALPPVQLMHLLARSKNVGGFRDGGRRYIAKEVKRLLDGNLFLQDKKGLRRLRANDIFVLTRTANEGLEVGESLRDAGIPHSFFKQDGLFQTREAQDVLDLMSAVVDLQQRDLRVKAWLTPFFGLTVEQATRARELNAEQVLVDRLFDWHSLAMKRDFTELFSSILNESGLVRRLLLLDPSERGLTNYLHLLELLLEQATNTPCTADELVTWLRRNIVQSGNDGQDLNVQRLETERDAVQIMTLHKSKGLEAGVVFLTGGLSRWNSNQIRILPGPNGERLVFIGKLSDPKLEEIATREDEEENQRLYYVGLTRAKARLYLPYFATPSDDDRSALGGDPELQSFSVTGSYRCVQQRLSAIMSGEGATERLDGDGVLLFERVLLDCDESLEQESATFHHQRWEPPAQLLDAVTAGDESEELATLRRRHAGFAVTSYSRMKQLSQGISWSGEVERFDEVDEPEILSAAEETENTLRGGRETGQFLHDLLEQAPLESFASFTDPETWRQQEPVAQMLSEYSRRHGVSEKHTPEAARIVHTAMTAPVALGKSGVLDGIYAASDLLREMEFLYPFPEEQHPRLTEAVHESGFAIERGYVKGFVDLIFTHQGRAWVGDWKSDRLKSWDASSVARHAQEHYAIQARLYALALVKMLGIQSEAAYEARFGGLLFLFIRAMQPHSHGTAEPNESIGKRGIYHLRPSFAEILEWENDLRSQKIRLMAS